MRERSEYPTSSACREEKRKMEIYEKGRAAQVKHIDHYLLTNASKHVFKRRHFPPHKQLRQAYAAKPCDLYLLG